MTDVSLAPLATALAPVAIQVSAVVIAAGFTWAAAQFSRLTHRKLAQGALDRVTRAAQAEAGAMIAADANNLAGAAITIGNSMVASAASRIITAMPEALDAAGLTPSHVAVMVAGELGKLMAAAPAAAAKAA
jgi:hypothetical protein